MFLISFCSCQLVLIRSTRTFPIPCTVSNLSGVSSMIFSVSFPNFSTILFANLGPTPLTRPEPRYLTYSSSFDNTLSIEYNIIRSHSASFDTKSVTIFSQTLFFFLQCLICFRLIKIQCHQLFPTGRDFNVIRMVCIKCDDWL